MLHEYRLVPDVYCDQDFPCRVQTGGGMTWILYCRNHVIREWKKTAPTAPPNPLTHDIRRGSVTGKRRRNTA